MRRRGKYQLFPGWCSPGCRALPSVTSWWPHPTSDFNDGSVRWLITPKRCVVMGREFMFLGLIWWLIPRNIPGMPASYSKDTSKTLPGLSLQRGEVISAPLPGPGMSSWASSQAHFHLTFKVWLCLFWFCFTEAFVIISALLRGCVGTETHWGFEVPQFKPLQGIGTRIKCLCSLLARSL